MIYVLFGPPGVGKTYIGNLASHRYSLFFFDADDEIQEQEKIAIKEGKYTQAMRDEFVDRLKDKVAHLHRLHQNFILAEAFTKEANRADFYCSFSPRIKFIRITTPYSLVEKRILKQSERQNHVISSLNLLKYFWTIFDRPHLPHATLINDQNFRPPHLDPLFSLLHPPITPP